MVSARQSSANDDSGFVGRSRVSASLLVVAPPATLRHPSHLLPLLPSGPGGVHKLSSRRHQRSHHKTCSHRCGCLSTRGRAGCTRHLLCLALWAACAARMGVLSMRRTRHVHFRGFEPRSPTFTRLSAQQRSAAFNDLKTGGESGIRTREAGFSRLHTFQACSFNHSDTSPQPTAPRGCPAAAAGKACHHGRRRILGMSASDKLAPRKFGQGGQNLAQSRIAPRN